MPGNVGRPEVTTEQVEEIPLYLIPKAIAEQIKKNGDAVFHIQVERKFHHRYTVKVETLDEHARRVAHGNPAPEEGD